MRGRGGPRPIVPVEEPYRINERIRVPEVRLIIETEDGNDQNLGVMPTAEALKLARERELDLVEVAPNAQPPVCKVMDYGRFKYQMERKAREQHRAGRAGRAAAEMKNVQLSPRIDEHDMNVKIDRAVEFLNEGHPVRMVVRFLGKDMRHPEVGMRSLQEALERLGARVPISIDQPPRMEGRQLFALVRLAKGAKAKVPAAQPVEPAEAVPSVDGAGTTIAAPPAEPPVEPAGTAAEREPVSTAS